MNTTFIIYAVNTALTLFVVGGLIWIDCLKDFV